MNIQKIRKEIEIHKRNAIENIESEAIIPAMWDISTLIDLKAQEKVLKAMEDKIQEEKNDITDEIIIREDSIRE